MKNYSREQEMREFYIHEKYILSNFDLNSVAMYNATLPELKIVKKNLSNFREKASKVKGCDIPEDFMNVYFLAKCYAKSKFSDTKNIEIASKVAALLHSEILDTPICNYLETRKSKFSDIDEVEINVSNTSFIKAMYTFFNSVNINDYINDTFPYLYTNKEIDEFEKKISECIKNSEKYEIFQEILSIFFKDLDKRIKLEYGSHRLFYERQRNTNSLRDKHSYNLTDISMHVDSYKELIKEALYVVYHFNEEYELWKYSNDTIKAVTSFSNRKFECFSVFYYNADDQKLYDFFETLNEPHAFDKMQKDYIRDMASKLRIASHLDQEYTNYKKLYNPDACDFVFGEDEAEEATVISKDHLKRLSHFEEEKLTNLLEKLKENQYIEENTRPKDWLFAFGMSGDEKPEFFKKIQWIGSSKNRGISPSYFIDFIGILGYDLNKIYFEKSKITISILNSCFMTTVKAIDQNSFNRDKDKGEFIPTPKHKTMAKLVKECGLLTE